MEKKLNNKLGKVILSMLVVMFATSVYAACETKTECSGDVCSEVTICTTIPPGPPVLGY